MKTVSKATLLNTTKANDQQYAQGTLLDDGRTLQIFFSSAGATLEIRGRLFSASGEALGKDFLIERMGIESSALSNLPFPDVTALGDGRFAVTYSDISSDYLPSNNVGFYELTKSGVRDLGAATMGETTTYWGPEDRLVDAAFNGKKTLAVWSQDVGNASDNHIFAAVPSASGQKANVVKVNTTTLQWAQALETVALANDTFAVVWKSNDNIRLRIVTQSGAFKSPERTFETRSEQPVDIADMSVVATKSGFAVVYNLDETPMVGSIYARIFGTDGKVRSDVAVASTPGYFEDVYKQNYTVVENPWGGFSVFFATLAIHDSDYNYGVSVVSYAADGRQIDAPQAVDLPGDARKSELAATLLANGDVMLTWREHDFVLGDRSGTSTKYVVYDIGDRLIEDTNSSHSISGRRTDEAFFGNKGNDTIRGAGGMDTIHGDAGADKLFGGAGNDTLFGGAGNDSILAEDGNDRVEGGQGNETISGGRGNDTLLGDAGTNWVSGDDGNDSIIGGSGADSIYGGKGNDSIFAGDGRNYLEGGVGNDFISSGSGVDRIVDGAGNDTIISGAGADKIVAGAGADLISLGGTPTPDWSDFLTGEPDRDDDVVIYTSVSESGWKTATRDTITGFGHNGDDVIDLTRIDANPLTTRNDALLFIPAESLSGGESGYLTLRDTGDYRTMVEIYLDSDRRPEMTILIDSPIVNRDDFLL